MRVRSSASPLAETGRCNSARGRHWRAATPLSDRSPAPLSLRRSPTRRRCIAPAPERAGEGSRIGRVEHRRDFADREVAVVQHLPRHFEANLVREFLVADSAGVQASIERPGADRE